MIGPARARRSSSAAAAPGRARFRSRRSAQPSGRSIPTCRSPASARMQEIYDKSMARTSFTLVMLPIAAGMALLLGVVGIYGVISYAGVAAHARDRHPRWRSAPSNRTVRQMFVRHGLRLAGSVGVCGLGAALALTRLMSSLLFDVSPLDPLTYGGVSLGLAAAAFLASYLPAQRATAVAPVDCLRAE